eukprot:gnl/MRDRNA2_/MRDRNA2_19548_c0_seq1.p1 gnl/MRDRNA2_/MRDRNA2_19548_c0~~gnl/MRDRNA2_/MRDRNA2_19548_c0_seq1.p1  ORF type:complete len:374 (+),score=66.21 gnl/MRDRNA2_/MRDRNA2_19548_c0_seq1:77-1198(+)
MNKGHNQNDGQKKKKRLQQAANASAYVHPVADEQSCTSDEEEDDNCKGDSAESTEDESQPLNDVMDKVIQDDSALDWWRKTSGLHTVEKWVKNYRKHPAGWAALLMIHGVPEMTGRLRSKVENYAIYAALFLSAAIPTMFIPWDPLVTCYSDDTGARRLAKPKTGQSGDITQGNLDWECEIRKRVFFYFLGAGIASHMLCIMLSMSFVNALNEAARDSDVYRMFARGQGFKATVKCQMAFRIGAACDLISMLAAAHLFMGWEAVVFAAICVAVVFKIYKQTADLLYKNTSIVKYWREELGGKPDADDPYDLECPVERFAARVEEGREFKKKYPTKRESEGRASVNAKKNHIHERMTSIVTSGPPTTGIAAGWR